MPVEIGKVEKWLGMISKLGYKFFWTRIVRVGRGFLQEKATVEKVIRNLDFEGLWLALQTVQWQVHKRTILRRQIWANNGQK